MLTRIYRPYGQPSAFSRRLSAVSFQLSAVSVAVLIKRVQHEVSRAERQYHAVEPDNRLVARTLEARWEEALKKQRQMGEEYHRFLAKLPTTLANNEPPDHTVSHLTNLRH